ncbi:MAG TPA: hypothetical protein VD908_12115 [Cytophagales bacterium]|nr:hypothetical protein [Cytophagales bacterium]
MYILKSSAQGLTEIPLPSNLNKPDDFSVMPDTSGNWGIYLKDFRNYYFMVVDKAGGVLAKKTIDRKDEMYGEDKIFVGGFYSSEGFYFFFKNNLDNIHFYSYFLSKKNTDDVYYKNGIVSDNNEIILKTFSVNNTFYIMTMNKKENTVSFLKFMNESQFERRTFILEKGLFKILKKGNFIVVSNNEVNQVSTLTNSQKLFVDDGAKFYFVLDNNSIHSKAFGNTKIVCFDLINGNVESSVLPGKSDVSSSWYLDGKLFKFMQGVEDLRFYIYKVDDKSIIKKYEYKYGDSITVAPSGVLSGEELLEKEKKIFDKLTYGGSPFMQVVKKENGEIYLFAGSYRETQAAGMMMGGMGTTSISTPSGTATIPGGSMMTSGPGGVSNVSITWFNTLLDNDFNVQKTRGIQPDIFKLEKYINALSVRKSVKNGVISLKIGDAIYVAYVSEREIRIVKIR